jgi:DNA-binding CsgD family transcriptional regulator
MLVAGGYPIAKSAIGLSVSVRTVDGQLDRSFAKRGIERREQVVQLVRVRSEA